MVLNKKSVSVLLFFCLLYTHLSYVKSNVGEQIKVSRKPSKLNKADLKLNQIKHHLPLKFKTKVIITD